MVLPLGLAVVEHPLTVADAVITLSLYLLLGVSETPGESFGGFERVESLKAVRVVGSVLCEDADTDILLQAEGVSLGRLLLFSEQLLVWVPLSRGKHCFARRDLESHGLVGILDVALRAEPLLGIEGGFPGLREVWSVNGALDLASRSTSINLTLKFELERLVIL